MTATVDRPRGDSAIRGRPAWVGSGVLAVLVAAAFAVPPIVGFFVIGGGLAPLSATWQPRTGPGTVAAVVLAVALAVFAVPVAARLRWRGLLAASFATSLAWLLALALVDGETGLTQTLRRPSQFLPTARSVTDVSALLHEYVSRIGYAAAPDNWPTHIAGHPPGALLFFVGLDRVGLGGDLAAAVVVVVLAATIPAAVLITLRCLGAEPAARRAAPFLVGGPAAIWSAVSADAMFAAVAAWGLCLLAVAATTPSGAGSARLARAAAGVASGLLLGYCAYLSYGLVLLGVLVLAVLLAARSWRVLIFATPGALAVAAAFTVGGFAWWSGYPELSQRYWDGAAGQRPGGYWTWADLASLGVCAGPVAGAAVAGVVVRARDALRDRIAADVRVPVLLAGAALACTVLAAASQMSRAEVERIWLPFVPWLLCATALLDTRWRRRGFAAQLAAAVLVQSLLRTAW